MTLQELQKLNRCCGAEVYKKTKLSQKMLNVLKLVEQSDRGMTNQEIADALNEKISVVRVRMQDLSGKTNISYRMEINSAGRQSRKVKRWFVSDAA